MIKWISNIIRKNIYLNSLNKIRGESLLRKYWIYKSIVSQYNEKGVSLIIPYDVNNDLLIYLQEKYKFQFEHRPGLLTQMWYYSKYKHLIPELFWEFAHLKNIVQTQTPSAL